MQNRPAKIIIDTNLFISFLITKNFTRLNDLILSKKCVLIFSDELIKEIIDVARRPKFRRFFSSGDMGDLLTGLYKHGEIIEIKTEVSVCRDQKDNFLLALATDGAADFLLTGDHDLLVLEKYNNTSILNISEFLRLHE